MSILIPDAPWTKLNDTLATSPTIAISFMGHSTDAAYISDAFDWTDVMFWTCALNALPDDQLNGACGGVEENGHDGEDETLDDKEAEPVPVDENLFTGEDLDELDEELNTLDLDDWQWWLLVEQCL